MTKLHETLDTTSRPRGCLRLHRRLEPAGGVGPQHDVCVAHRGGGPEVGARYALDVKMGRRSVPMEYRITELVAPERLVLVGEGSGIWTEDIITFTETETGTRVDYEAEIKLSGLLGLVQPLLGRAFDGIGKGAVSGMKRELDARA